MIAESATASDRRPRQLAGSARRRGGRQTGLWRDAFRRLLRSRLAVVSGILLILLALAAIFAPFVAPYDYTAQDYSALTQPPSRAHWLGTDDLGRDILSRLIYGRPHLAGGRARRAGGHPPDRCARRPRRGPFRRQARHVHHAHGRRALLDPESPLHHRDHDLLARAPRDARGAVAAALATLDAQTGGLIGVFIGIGLINWMPAARLVRGTAVSLKEKEFVEAARGMGASDWRIMAQHLLPNVVPIIVVTATIGIPQAIIYEAGISFLGLGARPPMPSWGLMIAEAIPNLRSYPYMLVSPALALSFTVLAFNFLGDGLRDALDPWMER